MIWKLHSGCRSQEHKTPFPPTLIWRIIILGGTGCEHIFSCPLLPVSETKFQVRMNKKWGLPFTQTPLMGCNASECWGPDHLSPAHGVECFTKGKASQVDVELLPLSTKFSTTKSRVLFRKKFTIVPAPNIRAIAQRFCPGEKQAYNRELQISLLKKWLHLQLSVKFNTKSALRNSGDGGERQLGWDWQIH